MASTHKHIRSSTANKRPTTAIADGQIALNTNTTSPGLFFKDSTGATIIKVGPVHIGTAAPNSTVPSGGSSGNSTGEVWLDTSLTPNGVKIWDGSAWVNATPIGSTTVQGLLELATSAETQTGSDTARAVTPAGLQSKVSDSTSTTSSTTIASSTAVKAAYDLANAALPKAGGVITGALEIGTTGSLVFEGSTADGNETTLAVVDPTADRTITLPNVSGTVITSGDTGTVTSTMIADGTIVNGDINAAAAIAHTKLANITAGSVLMGNASNIPTATAISGDVTITSSGVTAISSGVIVNADVNASAAIAGTKISPDFGSQNTTTTGTSTAASFIPTSSTAPTNGVYLPAANTLAISTGGSERLRVDSSGRVGIGTASPSNILEIGGEAIVRLLPSADNTSSSIYLGRTTTSGNRYRADITADTNGLFFATAAAVNTTPTERARIDSSGRLLVGTSTARANFSNSTLAPLVQVEGANSNAARLQSLTYGFAGVDGPVFTFGKHRSASVGGTTLVAADDQIGWISFQGSDGTEFVEAASVRGFVDGTPGANDMPGRLVFSTTADGASTSTERMRITNDGLVYIGTPAAGGNGTVYFRRQSDGGATNYIGADASDSALFQIVNANGGGITRFNISGGSADSFQFYNNATERVRITAAGQLRLAGAGITFNGDTAAANELDDYEEGTFTPTIVGTTAAGTGTYSVQVGRYTKIGNTVRFQIYLTWSAHTGTGNMRVAGLPFTNVNVANVQAPVALGPSNLTFSNSISAFTSTNSTVVLLFTYATGAAEAELPIDTAATIRLAGVYEAA